MSYGIVAQFVERKNKLFVYEVRGFNGGAFETMIKENANNYRGLRQVKNIDEPTDGSFVGCYYEPKMEASVMFKDDDNTNAGLSILTTFTFVTNDDLTFLQETNKFYVFTVNKPFADGDKTYILNGQAIRMTKQSGDVDLRSQGLPTNRNFTGEMWCLGLQEVSKLINDQKSNIIFYHNEISELPDDAEVWIDKTFEIGLESQTLINSIQFVGEVKDTEKNIVFDNINLDVEIKNGFLFPLKAWPINVDDNNLELYLPDYDPLHMDINLVKDLVNVTGANWISIDENESEFDENSILWVDELFNKYFGDTSMSVYTDSTRDGTKININSLGKENALTPIDIWQLAVFNSVVIPNSNLQINSQSNTYTAVFNFNTDYIDNWIGTSIAFPQYLGYYTITPNTHTMYGLVGNGFYDNQLFFNIYKFSFASSSFINSKYFSTFGTKNNLSAILLNFYLINYRSDFDLSMSNESDKSFFIYSAVLNAPMLFSQRLGQRMQLKSNFFKIRKNKTTSELFLTPKINNISNYNSFFLNINAISFPLLPKKIENSVNVSTDLSKLDITKDDWSRYQCFMFAKNLDIFNNLFNLMNEQTNWIVNSNKLAELHEKVDPDFIEELSIFNFKIAGEFMADKYKIKKIKQINIYNIYGTKVSNKINFSYKDKNEIIKSFTFEMKSNLFSGISINKTLTTILL